MALPIDFLLSTIWAWRHRAEIRARAGPSGLFSLWFPLLTALVPAWVTLSLVPSLLGSLLGTISLFQPDMGLALIATAATGVLWAVFRLGWPTPADRHSLIPDTYPFLPGSPTVLRR